MKRLPKIHGKTFFTRPRWFTEDVNKAGNSTLVWRYNEIFGYSLSLFGIVNGLLIRIGLIMYAEIDRETREIKKWYVRRNRR